MKPIIHGSPRLAAAIAAFVTVLLTVPSVFFDRVTIGDVMLAPANLLFLDFFGESIRTRQVMLLLLAAAIVVNATFTFLLAHAMNR